MRDWGLARDAFQETLIKASKKWQEINLETLPAWLKTVTHNHSVDIIRKNNRFTSIQEDFINYTSEGFDSFFSESGRVQQKKRMKNLERCMEELQPSNLKLVIAFYRDRKKCADIASKLGNSANAVRLKLVRLREKLKKCIESKMEVEN